MYFGFLLVVFCVAVLAEDDLCPESLDSLDDLLSSTRVRMPHYFSLPNKVGIVGIYQANISNLDTFARDPSKQVFCVQNSMLVPVTWLAPPTGSFVSHTRLGRALQKVFKVTVKTLEASINIDLDVSVAGFTVARLRTLTVTRLADISIVSEGFGVFGNVVNKATTILIGLFRSLFLGFLETVLKTVIQAVMISIPIKRPETPVFPQEEFVTQNSGTVVKPNRGFVDCIPDGVVGGYGMEKCGSEGVNCEAVGSDEDSVDTDEDGVDSNRGPAGIIPPCRPKFNVNPVVGSGKDGSVEDTGKPGNVPQNGNPERDGSVGVTTFDEVRKPEEVPHGGDTGSVGVTTFADVGKPEEEPRGGNPGKDGSVGVTIFDVIGEPEDESRGSNPGTHVINEVGQPEFNTEKTEYREGFDYDVNFPYEKIDPRNGRAGN